MSATAFLVVLVLTTWSAVVWVIGRLATATTAPTTSTTAAAASIAEETTITEPVTTCV